MKKLKIRDITIGEGTPKIAVPITGKNATEIINQARKIVENRPDLVEWRIDFFEDLFAKDKLKKLASDLRKILGNIVLLITFRTKNEGGNQELSDTDYFKICSYVVTNELSDLIDVELFHDKSEISKLLNLAHAKGIHVIMSNHNFKKTPAKFEMISRLHLMAASGADIAKIAVMPQNVEDVLNLLEATYIAHKALEIPLITMSMGDIGKISRISGQIFGSAVTFGAVGQVSAPGQISLTNLKQDIKDLEI
ncbi:type I 3-dehydroquinate dehydratase [Liquorilactobacillus sicerae]|uniref:type I 3-dehydroquinate dehydratase n=1 Tax=Liquorilactobacillus sicerae TaxID=1416943 RepID=UPI00248159AD|nr:type I 3-dehydroquinate dehydratase [Liquorilactobacillus sicerae]